MAPSRNVDRVLFLILTFFLLNLSTVESLADDLTQARQKAVAEAWRQERILVEKHGNGQRNWTEAEKKELLETGKVRGYEGHHINDVSNNPKLAGNPDNIKFVKGRKEHLQEHGGSFKNPTKGNLSQRSNQIALDDEKTGYTGDNPFLKVVTWIGAIVIGAIKLVFSGGIAAGLISFLVGIGAPILGFFGVQSGEPTAAGCGCLTIIIGVCTLIAAWFIFIF